MGFYGPRMTRISWSNWSREPSRPWPNVCGPPFQLDPQMSFETVTATSRYVLHLADDLFSVELFLLSDDAHDLERFARRRREHITRP